MTDCKWVGCSNEARAKSPFCSGTCKKRFSRASGTNVPVEEEVGQRMQDAVEGIESFQLPACAPSLEHYHEHPDMYAPRLEPDRLNWGVKMDRDELLSDTQRDRGVQHNRVSIPGDWDYEGVCRCVGGVWTVGACL